jgi:hypothetical protein
MTFSILMVLLVFVNEKLRFVLEPAATDEPP